MDLDSIISLIILLVFFILPSILKQLGVGQKKKASAAKKKRRLRIPFLEKVRERVDAFFKELEAQARKARQEEEGPASVWETLDEREDESGSSDPFEPDWDDEVAAMESEGEPTEKGEPEPAVFRPPAGKSPLQQPLFHSDGKPSAFRIPSHELQKAIVWSEILSKPLALRENERHF